MTLDAILSNALTSLITALVTIPGTLLAARVAHKAEKKKKIRESLEEIYKLSEQLNIWTQVTLRYFYKEIDKTDYYRVSIPGEYLEDCTKEPEYPRQRLEMLVSFDAPSLAKHLPEYLFIVSEMREVRYVYEQHKLKDTLDYYFGGVRFDEYEKMSGKQVNDMNEFLQYVTATFPKLHANFRVALNELAHKS